MMLGVLGVLVQAIGAAMLFMHWRAKRGLSGAMLALAWALIIVGAAPWFAHVSPERALALGVLAPMAWGLALLAPDGLARVSGGASGKRKREPRAEEIDAEAPAPAGRRSRTIARWYAGLIAAPALALAAAGAWQAFTVGAAEDRIVFSGLIFIAVWTAASLWLLAAARPWRAAGIATVLALALGASVYAAIASGAS